MEMTRATLRDSAGMTVAEVIIALFVITVGLVGLIAAMPLATSLIGGSNLQTTATFLTRQRFEQIKNARWTSAVDALGGAGADGAAAIAQWPDEDYGTIAFPGAANCGQADRSGGCRFRRQVRISDCSVLACSGIPTGTAGIATFRQVTVTVFFFPLAGTGQRLATEDSVQLVTLVARRP